MKEQLRVQSTLNREVKGLISHPENIIYKTKNEVEYMWQGLDKKTYFSTIYYGKQGNVIGLFAEREDDIIIHNYRLKTA